jgi:aspartyl/asparaginyl beta-hydroxylase (cupin superfamily)
MKLQYINKNEIPNCETLKKEWLDGMDHALEIMHDQLLENHVDNQDFLELLQEITKEVEAVQWGEYE